MTQPKSREELAEEYVADKLFIGVSPFTRRDFSAGFDAGVKAEQKRIIEILDVHFSHYPTENAAQLESSILKGTP